MQGLLLVCKLHWYVRQMIIELLGALHDMSHYILSWWLSLPAKQQGMGQQVLHLDKK